MSKQIWSDIMELSKLYPPHASDEFYNLLESRYKVSKKVKRKAVKVNLPQQQIQIQDKTPLSQTFDKWVEMRKKMKGGITDYAIELGKNELRKLSGGDVNKAIDIINQSILNSWKGFFPLKNNNNATSNKQNELSQLLNESLNTLQGD